MAEGIRMERRSRSKSVYKKESPDEIRARFEKEAHDRERKEIMELKANYDKWVSENSIRQLMYK